MSRQSGQDQQLTHAYANRRAKLRGSVRHLESQDAEDVYQDVFVRILERSQTAKVTKLNNLLRHVARCLAIDRLRRKDSRLTSTLSEAGKNVLDAAADPERYVMGAERLGRVMTVIDAMPERRREIFMLHRIEELTYAQIARQLGLSIKTVEKHMALAMRQLSDADD